MLNLQIVPHMIIIPNKYIYNTNNDLEINVFNSSDNNLHINSNDNLNKNRAKIINDNITKQITFCLKIVNLIFIYWRKIYLQKFYY